MCFDWLSCSSTNYNNENDTVARNVTRIKNTKILDNQGKKSVKADTFKIPERLRVLTTPLSTEWNIYKFKKEQKHTARHGVPQKK